MTWKFLSYTLPVAMACALPALPATAGAIDLAAEASCKKGDYAACEKAGDSYAYANAKERDVKKAETYLRKACKKGRIGSACTTLGYLYVDGYGFEHDNAIAGTWYVRGCEYGHASGCYMAGSMARHDDKAKAADYFRKALTLDPEDKGARRALDALIQ